MFLPIILSKQPVYNPIDGSVATDAEQAGIAAMFAASSEQWEKTQERMAT